MLTDISCSPQEAKELARLEDKIRRLFNKGCVEYGLLEDGDRILLAVSGGKDSLELVRLMGRRAKIFKPRIEVKAVHVVMDNIPYESDTSYLKAFCEENGVALEVLHSCFEESTDRRKTKCFLCSWNRRKALLQYATEHGFNKVALGHHQDDILTTMLMNITFEGSFSTMMPKLKMEHYPVSIIRPLCLVKESMIREYAERAGFHKQKAACPFEEVTKRAKMQEVFNELEEINPEARNSMWKAISPLPTSPQRGGEAMRDDYIYNKKNR